VTRDRASCTYAEWSGDVDSAPLRIAIVDCRPAFVPRARWVLETLADALGRAPEITVGPRAEAEVVYAPNRPASGVWIPAQPEAQEFFERRDPFPTHAVYRAGALVLLFPPRELDAPIPGDIVASAFFLLARWDELCVSDRDRFDRLPLEASSFGQIAGLDLEEPAVEGYIAALRRALGIPEPREWTVYLTHDIDRLRRRTAKGVLGMARRRGPRALASLIGRDPWDNVPDLLWTTSRRGLASTVYLIGRNLHPLDGTPARHYDRHRARLARAVRASGSEVGLHASFTASESGGELQTEWDGFRAEVGAPVTGVRYHYLRFRYHETVRWLENAGVTYDASLGASEAPGFVCGIARPFRPYLIGEERPARLLLVPLAVMDTALHSRLKLDAAGARERALSVLDAVRRAGGAACLLWHNTYLADDRAPGYGALWDDLLDDLTARGATLGPVAPPTTPGSSTSRHVRVVHLTSVHRPRDVRIFHKEATAATRDGGHAGVFGLAQPAHRAQRLLAGWRLMRDAAAMPADVYHVHDPELLPGALRLARRTGTPVVYDVHEYLGQTTRTKRWLPGPLRAPLAWAAERIETAFASRLDGVVAVNADLAARFAAAGADPVTSVTNAPWGDAFDDVGEPEGPVVLYVGGLGPLRGLEVMRAAFPLVTHPGARLLLAGPGEPGEFVDGVEHLGTVDHTAVPALLRRAAIAWIPLQMHGNYARAVPTKLTEAMAAGRPVVASDMGRMAAIVRAAGCGILVAPGDPAAHAAAIDTLLGDPGLAGQMGAAGRAAFLDGLAFDTQAERLNRFYAEVTGA
jgi:glycosyltransferase involved in cell wall biosynthesis